MLVLNVDRIPLRSQFLHFVLGNIDDKSSIHIFLWGLGYERRHDYSSASPLHKRLSPLSWSLSVFSWTREPHLFVTHDDGDFELFFWGSKIVTSYVAPNPGISRQKSNARNRDPLNLIFVSTSALVFVNPSPPVIRAPGLEMILKD